MHAQVAWAGARVSADGVCRRPAVVGHLLRLVRTGRPAIRGSSTTSTTRHYAASTMKLALVMAAFASRRRGSISTSMDSWRSATSSAPRPTARPSRWIEAVRQRPSALAAGRWARSSLRWLAYRAIVRSSNLATNLLLDAVGTRAIGRLLTDVGATGSQRPARDRGRSRHARPAWTTWSPPPIWLSSSKRCTAAKLLGDARESKSSMAVLRGPAGQRRDPGRTADAAPRSRHKSGWVDGVVHDAAIVGVGVRPTVRAASSARRRSWPSLSRSGLIARRRPSGLG